MAANLIENTLRHGGGTIGIEAVEDDGFVVLHVTDEGDGFPTAFLGRAFERFSRAGGSRDSAGAGLGLAIVAAVAQAHGGSVAVSNRAVGGADVALTLPARTQSKRSSARTSVLTHD
jgi:signal transduction histidine kinase